MSANPFGISPDDIPEDFIKALFQTRDVQLPNTILMGEDCFSSFDDIEELNLSVETCNQLKQSNINLVGELTSFTHQELASVEGITEQHLNEIIKALEAKELSLFEEEDEEEVEEDTRMRANAIFSSLVLRQEFDNELLRGEL